MGNIKDAMQFWIERARELGRPAPEPKGERPMLALDTCRIFGRLPHRAERSATESARAEVPAKQTDSGATTGYEAELWAMADTLRGSMDAAEYKTDPTDGKRRVEKGPYERPKVPM